MAVCVQAFNAALGATEFANTALAVQTGIEGVLNGYGQAGFNLLCNTFLAAHQCHGDQEALCMKVPAMAVETGGDQIAAKAHLLVYFTALTLCNATNNQTINANFATIASSLNSTQIHACDSNLIAAVTNNNAQPGLTYFECVESATTLICPLKDIILSAIESGLQHSVGL